MEIPTKIQPSAVAPALQRYNQDDSGLKRNEGVALSGAVVDIQSRQEPLGVALNSSLRALVENAGLPESAVTSNTAYSSGPEGVAARLSSVAAHLVASTQGSSEEKTDTLPQLISSIRDSINQGFDEAERIAADPANVPLQQARDITRQQLDSLESMLGLRDNRAA